MTEISPLSQASWTMEGALAGPRVLEFLGREKLIPVLRTNTADDALWLARELVASGFRVLEITCTIPEAPLVLQELTRTFPEVLFGAGTVLDEASAWETLAAGAGFIVSPVLDEAVLSYCVEENRLCIPGVLTPTEIHRAHLLGALAVKLFPAACAGGPRMLKALRDVFPHIKIIPTGGVSLEDIGEYLDAGAFAVGISGQLSPEAAILERNGKDIRKLAEQASRVLALYMRNGKD